MSELKEEIISILEQAAKAKNIQNYDLIPDIEAQVGDGFLSSFYKGDVLDKDTGKSFRVAIKKLPKYDYDYDGVFGNEIIFYTKILPALLQKQREANLLEPFNNTAECFASSTDKGKQFIALEHLQPEGYVLHEKKRYMNRDHLEMVFNTYGKFHALSFVLRKQNFEQYQEITKNLKDLFYMFTEKDIGKDSIVRTIEVALSTLADGTKEQEECKAIFKNIIATVEKSFIYNGSYRCLTHGDCWSNNMLFKYSKSGKVENFKLLDFQLLRDGTPIHDLSYFFYAAAAKEDMDSLEEYLKIYHDSFSKVVTALGEDPEEIFPYEVLVQEWKENALMGVVLGAYLWLIKLLAKEDYEDMLKEQPGQQKESMEEAFKSIVDLMEAVIKSDNYISKCRDIFRHAYDFGILTRDKAA